MTDPHADRRSESTLPTAGERISLTLTLLHPEVADLDAAVADRVSSSDGVPVTAAQVAALRAGDVASVPESVVAAVIDSTQLGEDVLLGHDPAVVLPAWDSLQALRELAKTSPGLVQLRSGAELSPQARADLLDLLDPTRRQD